MIDNILTTQAFSIQSNKGVYALFLGSGISRSSGIYTGWDVVLDLITKIAAVQDEDTNGDPYNWYITKYKEEPSYSVLLEKLVPTPSERMNLLKKYFESDSSQEREVQPTKAHKYIAKLVKEGYIKVIITPNFDRLLEKAFIDENINPYTITHNDDIRGMQPLVHTDYIIIKVNGDYLDSRFLNTEHELSEYPPAMKSLLDKVFQNFGLITCGWSAQWDTGIVNILKSVDNFRYPYYFTYIGKCNSELTELAAIRKGKTLQINDADSYFYSLYEKITALERVNASNPMNKDIVIARAKKYLKNSDSFIELEELVEEEVKKVYKKINDKVSYDAYFDKETFDHFNEIHADAISVLQPLLINITRWSRKEHNDIIISAIQRLATPPYQNNKAFHEDTIKLHYLSVTLLFYSVGLAALIYKKYNLLDKLFKIKKPDNKFSRSYERLLIKNANGELLDKENFNSILGTRNFTPFSDFLCRTIYIQFRESLINEEEYISYFDIYEYLLSLYYWNQITPLTFDHKRTPYGSYKWRRQRDSYSDTETIYKDFFSDAEAMQDNWAPIKQGMFDGSFDKYAKIRNEVEEFLKKIYLG